MAPSQRVRQSPDFQPAPDILRQLQVEIQEVGTQLQAYANQSRIPEPTEQQRHKARTLAGWLTCTAPLNPIRDIPTLDSSQPPMQVPVAPAFLRPRHPAAPQLVGKEAAHIRRHWRGYAQQLHTVAVPLNETLHWIENLSPSPADDIPVIPMAVAAMGQLDPAEKVRLAALGRASAALVAPLLTSYVRITI